MTSRNSIVWLPKEMYSFVEQFADPRFVWCPMPFDDSLPVEQTSFIDMDEHEEGHSTHQAAADTVAKDYDRNRDSGIDLSMDFEMPSPTPNLDVPNAPDESTDMSSSESESDKELPCRKISQNVNWGKRRRRSHPKSEDAGGRVRDNRSFAVHLGLNLDVEVTLKARVYGGLELSML